MHGLDPNGSSGFADDTTFHTDGTDAVSSMQAIVSPAGAYLTWLGQAVNMLKSKRKNHFNPCDEQTKSGNVTTKIRKFFASIAFGRRPIRSV